MIYADKLNVWEFGDDGWNTIGLMATDKAKEYTEKAPARTPVLVTDAHGHVVMASFNPMWN